MVAVKGRVETGNLRQIRSKLAHQSDRGQVVGLVKRSQRLVGPATVPARLRRCAPARHNPARHGPRDGRPPVANSRKPLQPDLQRAGRRRQIGDRLGAPAVRRLAPRPPRLQRESVDAPLCRRPGPSPDAPAPSGRSRKSGTSGSTTPAFRTRITSMRVKPWAAARSRAAPRQGSCPPPPRPVASAPNPPGWSG